jgi:hypothetical protein
MMAISPFVFLSTTNCLKHYRTIASKVWAMKTRKMELRANVPCMEQNRNAFKVITNVKAKLREIGSQNVDWIHFTQKSVQF